MAKQISCDWCKKVFVNGLYSTKPCDWQLFHERNCDKYICADCYYEGEIEYLDRIKHISLYEREGGFKYKLTYCREHFKRRGKQTQ